MPDDVLTLDVGGALPPPAWDGEALRYLDCNTRIGRDAGTRNLGARNVTPETLLSELDRVGVAEAIVHHTLAREYHPVPGNDALARELHGQTRLHPAWVVMPHHTGEMPEPAALVQQMLDAGAHLAVMLPAVDARAHRFSLAEWCVGPLLSELERRGVPLALDFLLFRRGEPPWDDLVGVCERHPDLPVILFDVQGRNNRTLYALLERHPNVHLQTAGFDVHAGLEDFAARFGAHRLIFGSGYPIKSIGSALLHVHRARLSLEEKTLIASGNLRRLLAGVRHAEVAGGR